MFGLVVVVVALAVVDFVVGFVVVGFVLGFMVVEFVVSCFQTLVALISVVLEIHPQLCLLLQAVYDSVASACSLHLQEGSQQGFLQI